MFREVGALAQTYDKKNAISSRSFSVFARTWLDGAAATTSGYPKSKLSTVCIILRLFMQMEIPEQERVYSAYTAMGMEHILERSVCETINHVISL